MQVSYDLSPKIPMMLLGTNISLTSLGGSSRKALLCFCLFATCYAFAPLAGVRAAQTSRLQSFEGGGGWINSAPLTPDGLRGKVVLVDFWEYTCINCLRTLPYLREWYRRYRDDGFVIVGVHTPEFDFSAQRANVAAAVMRLDIGWPVVLDEHAAIWKRYDNYVWPREYLFDRDGNLVESVAGEGAYPQTEAKIQGLLRIGNPHLSLPPVMALLPQDSYDKPGAVCYPQTAELLLKRAAIANATSSGNSGQDVDYDDAATHKDGVPYLHGYWHLTPEAAVSGESNGYFALRYHAIQVVAVMKTEGGSARVEVTQDGKPVSKADAGKDIRYDAQGGSYVIVDAPRAYDLVMNAHFGEYELKLWPKRDGLGIYDVAFESCEIPKP